MADGGIIFPHGEWDVARMLQQVRFYVFVSEHPLLILIECLCECVKIIHLLV
jgi:hypothetical protein